MKQSLKDGSQLYQRKQDDAVILQPLCMPVTALEETVVRRMKREHFALRVT